MSTIITIAAADQITDSRADINSNFDALNTEKIETSVIDTDTALAANSDAKIPSQKAVKTYIDTVGGANASETVRGIVEEATDAEVTAGTATGGTGAKLIVTPAKLATHLTTIGAADWVQLADATAAGSSTTLASGSFTARKNLRITINIVDVASASELRIRFNGDSSSIYSSFISTSGGAGVTRDAASGIEPSTAGGTYDYPMVTDMDVIANIATVRKAGFFRTAELGNAAATAPNAMVEGSFTFNDTTNAITSVSIVSSSGNISANSRITVYGSKD